MSNHDDIDDRTPFDIENSHNAPVTMHDLPVALLTVDDRDRIILANARAADLYEGVSEGLTGQSILILLPPKHQKRFVEAIRLTHADGAWTGRLLMQTLTDRALSIDAVWRKNVRGHIVMLHNDAAERMIQERDDARGYLAQHQRLFLHAIHSALAKHKPQKMIEWIEPFISLSHHDVPIEHRGAQTDVLVAIADPLLRCLVANCLQLADYAVHVAESIQEAETLMAKHCETLQFVLFDYGKETQQAQARLQRADNTLLLIQLFADESYTDSDIPVVPYPLRPLSMLQAVAQYLADVPFEEE